MSKFIIDADAVFEIVDRERLFGNGNCGKVRDLIKDLPETVIRCRNCKYLFLSPSPVRQFWCDRGIIPSKVREDDFCSKGKRKTDEKPI